ncbi:hypothetical protein GGR07_001186 [Bacteroides pyogenes]|nr:hypothetical protein [Bacteroides pyogenes]
MKTMNISASVEETVLRTPKNKKTPMENSTADKTIPVSKGKKEGNQDSMPNAAR